MISTVTVTPVSTWEIATVSVLILAFLLYCIVLAFVDVLVTLASIPAGTADTAADFVTLDGANTTSTVLGAVHAVLTIATP